MSERRSRKYLLITPCRDEAQYIQETIDTIVTQTEQPARWVIVDDGSTDKTPEILAAAAIRYPFIRVIRREDRGKRAVGPGVIEAFNEGASMDPDDAISLALETVVPLDTAPRISVADSETRAILDQMGITDRELDVLQKLGSGETDKEIADRLYISVRTVQSHVQNLLNKFEVTSRSAAVAKAFRIGLLH